jgi:hypothetical protein
MKLAYQKKMEEFNLKLEELPTEMKEDAKEIQKLVGNVNSIKSRGQKVSDTLMDQIRKRDRLLLQDVEDYYEDKMEENENGSQNDPKETMTPEQKANMDEGLSIEGELAELWKSGTKQISGSELRNRCPKCYKKIINTYDKGGDNGIRTSRYCIIEIKDSPEMFNLTTR